MSSIATTDFIRNIKSGHVEQGISVFKLVLYTLMFGLLTYLMREVVVAAVETRIATDQLAIEAALARVEENISRQPREEKGEYTLIVRKKLFGTSQPKQVKKEPEQQPATTTPLKLRLVGTFITPGSNPVAIIEHTAKREQDAFDVGESLFGEAKLVTVNNNSVVIDRNGTRESLEIEDFGGSGGSAVSDVDGDVERIEVAEAELDEALNNLPLLLTQARAVPYFKGGKAVGLRLFAIKNGSLFEKIGLRNGDVLQRINGNSLADFSQAMKLFEKLKQERSIKLEMERNRSPKTYLYEIR